MSSTTNHNLKTWGDVADYTWTHCWKRQKSARTVEKRVNRITNYCGLSFPLRKMGKGYWWTELQTDILDQDEVSNATVNRAVSVGTHALRFTYEKELHSVRPPKFEKLDEAEARQAWFTKDQVAKMAFIAIDIFNRKDLSEAIVFSAYTGLRQGEFLKLKPEDVHLDLNSLQVGQKKDRNGKSTGRFIPIHKSLIPIIESRMNNRYLFGDDWSNKDQLYGQFKKIRKYMGLDESYVWHSLRHSFCTWAGAVDHPRNIMAAAGHKSIDTTLRYCKATEEAVHAMVSKL